MSTTLHRRLAVVAAATLLTACGGSQEKAPDLPLAGRDCRRAQGDSAQAVCVALNEVERRDGTPAKPLHVMRRRQGWCVHTIPDADRMAVAVLDGEGVVEVSQGRVLSAFGGDSIGCPPAAVHRGDTIEQSAQADFVPFQRRVSNPSFSNPSRRDAA